MKKINILRKLILHERLDIVVKILYIESLEQNKDIDFYKKLYLKHIELHTGFKEDNKKNSTDFLDSFHDVIKNIKKNGFDSTKLVHLGNNGLPLTGAHRIACCIYFGIDCQFSIDENEKGISWNIDWFIKNHFTQEEIIDILKKYQELINNSVIILWPSCKIDYIENEVLRYKIFFEDTFLMEETIYDLYSFEKYDNKDIGIQQKAQLLGKYKYIWVVLLKGKIEKDSLRKRLISNIHDSRINKENAYFFTFHSGDSLEENDYIRNILLSRNYFYHLKLRTRSIGKSFYYLTKKLSYIYSRDMCIVGSGPLGIYNIVPVSDIDLIQSIVSGKGIQKLSDDIDLLDYQYYKVLTNDFIIKNAFFYWRGYKFINLELLQKIKSIGLRNKDLRQAQLIDVFLKENKPRTLEVEHKIRHTLKYIKVRIYIYIIQFGIYITKKLGIYNTVSHLWRKHILTKFR